MSYVPSFSREELKSIANRALADVDNVHNYSDKGQHEQIKRWLLDLHRAADLLDMSFYFVELDAK